LIHTLFKKKILSAARFGAVERIFFKGGQEDAGLL